MRATRGSDAASSGTTPSASAHSPPPQQQQRSTGRRLSPTRVAEYARYIGLDPLRQDLLWLAEQGLTAPLPEGWHAFRVTDADASTATPQVYYCNTDTGESMWDHPLDEQFRAIASAFATAEQPGDGRGAAKGVAVRDAATQAAVGREARSVQAVADTGAAATQAWVPQCDQAADPMPAEEGTMTVPEEGQRGTMTTPSLAPPCMVAGGGSVRHSVGRDGMWAPMAGSASLAADPDDELGSSASFRSCRGGMLSMRAASAAATAAADDARGPPAVAAAAAAAIAAQTTPTREQRRGAPAAAEASPAATAPPPAAAAAAPADGAAGIGGAAAAAAASPQSPQDEREQLAAMITPAAEALMREMVCSFQHQLLEHRREVYDAIAREWEHLNAVRSALCEPTPPPEAVPAYGASSLTPVAEPEPPTDWGASQWAMCYAAFGACHIAACVAVCLALPAIIGDWRDPLFDPQPAPTSYAW